LYPDFRKGLSDFIKLKWLDNCSYKFHVIPLFLLKKGGIFIPP
jgi:hypothetical protein